MPCEVMFLTDAPAPFGIRWYQIETEINHVGSISRLILIGISVDVWCYCQCSDDIVFCTDSFPM